jgi:hypothetical protein
VLEGQFSTHDSLERYLLKLNRGLAARCARGYLSAKFTALIKAFDDEPDMRLEDGESLWDKLVEAASSSLPPNEPRYPGEKPPYLSPQATKLVHALELDGFKVSELDGLKVSEGVLRRALPIDIGLPAVQSEIDRLLEKHGFFVPKRQLEQHRKGRALARSFGVVQIKPGFDPLKVQVHLDLHRLAPQIVATQIVMSSRMHEPGRCGPVEPELRWAAPRPGDGDGGSPSSP